MPKNLDAKTGDDRIFLNGVDALTGNYLTPPVTVEELTALAQKDLKGTTEYEQKITHALRQRIERGPTLGFDAEHLDDPVEARWGVIFAAGEDDKIKQALEPLIQHRADQLKIEPKVFEYQPGFTVTDFLVNNGVARGVGEVDQVPYYLLLLGEPDKIPFRFQYELDSEYATGRLCFDSPEGYAAYVGQLIDYETSKAVPNAREAFFWTTANKGDLATTLSDELLAQNLFDDISPKLGFGKQHCRGEEATKANLEAQFARTQPPALLFTASHGLGYSKPDPLQRTMQGALVDTAWIAGALIPDEQLFGGPHLAKLTHSNVRGLIHFAFACFGAGTPRQDDFSHGKSQVAPIIAEKPFVANLPMELLRRGALAFIGHVERACGYSFIGPTGKPQLTSFERAIDRLLKGLPAGHALRDMHDRGTQLGATLIEDLNDMDFGKIIPKVVIAQKWKERNDARAHILIGDPAARLRVKDIK
jgi:hypothetical protein